MASPPRRRLPLGRTSRRVGYEKRLRLLFWLFSLPVFSCAVMLLVWSNATPSTWILALVATLVGWAILQAWLIEQILRPLQTLSNVVAALREEDYSFRARGARRGDSLGDLALEINALASDLQAERLSSLDSAALVRRVLEAIDAPVLAFDEQNVLRLLNAAAIESLRLSAKHSPGQSAEALGLKTLLSVPDEQVTTLASEANPVQWMVRRTAFRQNGVPHTLVLLSDVSLALRQEERQAWQRLIRVLGHEINNSLTPIKSIAGSLRLMVQANSPSEDFERPLEVIEQRAESLNHFLAAYRKLAQLPTPQRTSFALATFLEQLVPLETRLPVQLVAGPEITLHADKDQLGQAIINLLRNAAEAAFENKTRPPCISLSWNIDHRHARAEAVLRVRDSGLGVANPSNLFVPFYTTKESGTGIGLALVKTIIEAHQGSITLGSHPEGGAQAEVRIPI